MPYRALPAGLQEVAERELHEVPGRIEKDLQHIKDWIAKQPHLRARTDDQWLLAFLRWSKFSLERTKRKMDLFYTMKPILPQMMMNKDPFSTGAQQFLKYGVTLPLPRKDPAGPCCFLVKSPEKPNLEIVTSTVIVKTIIMIGDMLMMEDDNFIVTGLEAIIDLENVPVAAAALATPTMVKTCMLLAEKVMPLRLKGVYVINIPKFMLPMINAVLSIAPSRHKHKAHFFAKNDTQELYKFIPQSTMPQEYGGDAGPISDLRDQLKAKLESYHEWFKEDDDYYSDETKRFGKPVTVNDFLGIEGSFRRIEID